MIYQSYHIGMINLNIAHKYWNFLGIFDKLRRYLTLFSYYMVSNTI